MKFHHFFILFVVLVFLIFPPIFVNQTDFFTNGSNTNDISKFSLFTVVISLIWSLLLYILSEQKEEKFSRNSLRISLISFILIFYFSFIFKQIKDLLGFPQDKMIFNLSKTEKFLSCLQIIVLCIYEEILYRKFLFTRLNLLLENTFTQFNFNHNKNIPTVISVFLVAILFGLAHRYSGIINVIFAFLSSLIFSLCYLKTKNICFPIISHVLYNILTFLTITKF